MIEKIIIRDGANSPVLHSFRVFRKNATFKFTPGNNIIIGPNGSGKTTLLHLMESYLLCRDDVASDIRRNNLSDMKGNFLGGVDVYADYTHKAFRMREPDELRGEEHKGLRNFNAFGTMFNHLHQSRGQNVKEDIDNLLSTLFDTKDFKFPDTDGELKEYIETHRTEKGPVTILLDEPDNNLDIDNIIDLKNMLTHQRDDIQIICVIHNPVLIHSLYKSKKVNFVETKRGYLKKIINFIKN